MKRFRCLSFQLDGTRNIYNSNFRSEEKKFQRKELESKYGEYDIEAKIQRWLSIPKAPILFINEATSLALDIERAYVFGNFYSGLTGACCLGERIFNQIILQVRNDYTETNIYKIRKSIRKDTIFNWIDAIDALYEWGIISEETKGDYEKLYKLRTESVHYQDKPQDLEIMAVQAIKTIFKILSSLFGYFENKKYLLLFDCPGEIYVRKEYEDNPFVRGFILSTSYKVGYKHSVVVKDESFIFEDNNVYDNKEISDEEFIKLRINFTGK